MSGKRQRDVEVFFQLKNTKKARRNLLALAEAIDRNRKRDQRKCGALGQVFAAGQVRCFNPLFDADQKDSVRSPESLARWFNDKQDSDLSGMGVLSFASSAAAKAAIKRLERDSDVKYAHLGTEKRIAGKVDPLRNRQWGLTAIELCQAQQLPNFDPGTSVKIGVIDTGIDIEHPDLIGAEITETRFTRGVMRDKDGHGTHVIGTIAAVVNNGIGIAGVCQSRNLMSMKALDPYDERGYFRAIEHAIRTQVRVLNISLGGPANPTERTLIRGAIRRGIIVVAAMGNQATSKRVYPAAYRNVIAVGASTESDEHWQKSNRGAHIDLVAPGTNIWSTVPRYRARRARSKLYDAEGWTGTSMAAAFVTGAVALCLAKTPQATLAEVRSALQAGADRIDGQQGFTHRLGWGRLNVYQTLSLI